MAHFGLAKNNQGWNKVSLLPTCSSGFTLLSGFEQGLTNDIKVRLWRYVKWQVQYMEPLCKVFAYFLTTVVVPIEWRLAIIYPIHKKGWSNYRSVSLPSIICTIVENILKKRSSILSCNFSSSTLFPVSAICRSLRNAHDGRRLHNWCHLPWFCLGLWLRQPQISFDQNEVLRSYGELKHIFLDHSNAPSRCLEALALLFVDDGKIVTRWTQNMNLHSSLRAVLAYDQSCLVQIERDGPMRLPFTPVGLAPPFLCPN